MRDARSVIETMMFLVFAWWLITNGNVLFGFVSFLVAVIAATL